MRESKEDRGDEHGKAAPRVEGPPEIRYTQKEE
jgi:hypothetical protein